MSEPGCRSLAHREAANSDLLDAPCSETSVLQEGANALPGDSMLKWFRALMPREERFFDLFEEHAAVLVAGAEALQELLKGGDNVDRFRGIVVQREQEADVITRNVMLAIRRTFITPFDRSDISDLIQSMDDAIDQMQKTVKTITLFEQTSFEPGMQEMGAAIVAATKLTSGAMPLMRSVSKNASQLSAFAEELTRIEERADNLHDEGLRGLYQKHRDGSAMAYIIGADIYGHLEHVVDRLEDVANEMSGIAVENV
jgi:predicted phosphate transport protein (TIGR00153 family)